MLEPGARERHQVLGGGREPAPELVLVRAALQQRPGGERAHRVRVARHAAPEHPGRLEHPLVVEARGPELRAQPGRLEVPLPEDALVLGRPRQAERPPDRLQVLHVDAGLLRELVLRVLRLRAEQPLDRNEREPLLLHRLPELLQAHAVGVQLVQQLPARLLRTLVGNVVQQALGFPVHGPEDAIAVGCP
jgi:hypothetical protein